MLNDNQLKLLEIVESRREAFYSSPKHQRRYDQGQGVLHAGIEFLHELLGNEVMEDALLAFAGSDPSKREDGLNLLSARLYTLARLEPQVLAKSAYSLAKASEEISAIANGDAARLFAEFPGKKGRRINAYRLAGHQLRALEWHEFLRHAGNKPAAAQNAVAQAYSETWSTISRWRNPVRRELGNILYKRAMETARQDRWVIPGFFTTAEEADALLKRDGQEYRDELRCSLKALK